MLDVAADLCYEHSEPEYGTGIAHQIEIAIAATLGMTPASGKGGRRADRR